MDTRLAINLAYEYFASYDYAHHEPFRGTGTIYDGNGHQFAIVADTVKIETRRIPFTTRISEVSTGMVVSLGVIDEHMVLMVDDVETASAHMIDLALEKDLPFTPEMEELMYDIVINHLHNQSELQRYISESRIDEITANCLQ